MIRAVLLLLAFVVPIAAFLSINKNTGCRARFGQLNVATEEKSISSIESPDFYWQYRLDRLASKKGGDLPFKKSNYPDVDSSKDLYNAYYLDLTLQGKLNGFDWVSEKTISDSEWLAIYKTICQWSSATVKANKPSTGSLPTNDFDLLKQFYPQLNYRDLETPFVVEEVGSNFPYKNMKDLLSAAVSGSLNIPGHSSVSSLDTSGIKKDIAGLKQKSLANIEAVYSDAIAYAKNAFPDDTSKAHYQSLRTKLAGFPQSKSEWEAYRLNVEKEIDEMARLASKPEDDHHHGHDEHHEDTLSVAQEFQAKYGKSLEEMQERMNKFKQDPEGFLESSVVEKFGKNGLDIWKKSQEFSAKLSVMSEADIAATESTFATFLKQA